MSTATSETIEWHDAERVKPDSDITVLVKGDWGGDPVWLGCWDDESGEWCQADGRTLYNVTHWADMPKGPT